jgi:putative transposase
MGNGTMLADIIQAYNYKRPHRSIDMLTPAPAHLLEGELSRAWKTYYQKDKAHQQNSVDPVKLNQNE